METFGGYNSNASQFAGGGFMPSPAGAAHNMTSPGANRKPSTLSTLRSLTVKQVYEGTKDTMDDQYKVDGEDLHNITMVGKITEVNETDVCLSLKLDDGTGTIELSYWVESNSGEEMNQRKAAWRVGTYVRVHGHLRSFQDKKTLQTFNIRPITDYNEVTYHFLKCIYEHLDLTKASRGMVAAPVAQQGVAMGSSFGGAPAAASAPLAVGNDGLTNIQREIVTVLNTPDALAKDLGLSVDEIASRTGNKYSIGQLKDTMEFLMCEGHAYTTSDDNHFRSTVCS